MKKFWKNLGITRKFSIIFIAMLCFILLLCSLSYGLLFIAHRRTIADIEMSFNIRNLVLEMDREIEKARRIKHEFSLACLETGTLDQKADFAGRVCAQLEKTSEQSDMLKRLISRSNVSEALKKSDININLYYSIANRCHAVFEELAEAARKLADEKSGLQNRLLDIAAALRSQMEKVDNLKIINQFNEMELNVKHYLLTRRRPLMQSALNNAFYLNKSLQASLFLNDNQKAEILKTVANYVSVAGAIPELDVIIRTKSNDFDLNAETLEPVSIELFELAKKEVTRSRARHESIERIIGIVLVLAALFGFLMIGFLAWIIQTTITRNIVRLTRVASEIQAGNLDIQDRVENQDELGRLSECFNEMTLRLKALINGLETQVEIRTKELTAANVSLKKEMEERRIAEKANLKLESELRQAHKMEAIGILAGGVAHDFNNILGIIIGNCELAMDDVPEWNPARLNLEEIITAGMRARDIVKQLLIFSRKTEQEKQVILLQPLIKETIALLRATIPATIEIKQDIGESLGSVKADPSQIHQVIINLCNNAAHAMEENGGVLEITAVETYLDEVSNIRFEDLKPGRYVKLTISDTGCGIDSTIIDQIFDPYFTTKEVGKGTGMGLSIVHGIVKRHKGSISVYSEPGKGAMFKILLPVVNEKPSGAAEDFRIVPGGRETILFVDDEESIVRAGRSVLERLGYQVDIQTDPEAALEAVRLRPKKYDLIITDMTMPKMTGDILAQRIFTFLPNTPVILCTGFSSKIDKERALGIGIRDYVEKPLNRYELAITVRKVLDGE